MLHEEAAELLEKAADLIETVGHTKGRYTEMEQVGSEWRVVGYCATGAINAAYCTDGDTAIQRPLHGHPALGVAIGRVCLEVNPSLRRDQPIAGIAQWNDRPERTPGEVVDVLKSVAKDLRNGA